MSVCVCVHLTAIAREVLVGWVALLSYNVKYERRLISLSSLAVHLSVRESVVIPSCLPAAALLSVGLSPPPLPLLPSACRSQFLKE